MVDIRDMSRTAANNNATPPDGWPESTMLGSQVNDVGRETFAALRRGFERMPYMDFGHVPTQTSGTTFTTPGTLATNVFEDKTYADIYAVGHKLRVLDGATYKYLTIDSVTDNSGIGPISITVSGDTITGSISRIYVHMVNVFSEVLAPYALTASIIQGYTGEMRFGFFSVSSVPSGWIPYTELGSIGNAGSGATIRANADTSALYTLFWDGVADADAPVSTGRGANAAADFAAGKTLVLPPLAGRVIGVTGSGASLTARSLGTKTGAETHVLTIDESPAHSHGITRANDDANPSGGGAGFGMASTYGGGIPSGSGTSSSAPIQSIGGDQAHNNMQPTAFVNCMIKL